MNGDNNLKNSTDCSVLVQLGDRRVMYAYLNQLFVAVSKNLCCDLAAVATTLKS